MLTTGEHAFMNMLNNSRYSQPKSLQGCEALHEALQAMLTGNASLPAVTTSKHTQANITIDIMNNIQQQQQQQRRHRAQDKPQCPSEEKT